MVQKEQEIVIKVLVIEDNSDFLESIGQIIEFENYQVSLANNVETALKMNLECKPHIALIDVRLGQASGIQLVPSLRQDNPGIITILMSAFAETEASIRSIRESVFDFLRKPFPIPDLLSTLQRASYVIRLKMAKKQNEQGQ